MRNGVLGACAVVAMAMAVGSCGLLGKTDGPAIPASEDQVELIAARKYMSGGIPLATIRSKDQLAEFVAAYSGLESSTRGFRDFHTDVQGDSTDFTRYSIVVFPRNEVNYNIEFTPQTPVWRGGDLVVEIKRHAPEYLQPAGGMDIFAYRVSKQIEAVKFVVGEEEIWIDNKVQ
jgi:hypothetical protein